MKTLLCILAAAALLCGCGKNSATGWEYKTVEVKDDEHVLNDDAADAFLAGKISSEKQTARMQKAVPYRGQFTFASDQIAELGSNHWELVTVVREATEDPKLVLFFKRPLK